MCNFSKMRIGLVSGGRARSFVSGAPRTDKDRDDETVGRFGCGFGRLRKAEYGTDTVGSTPCCGVGAGTLTTSGCNGSTARKG
jgi:hypothetical protein